MTQQYIVELDKLCSTILDVNENIQSVSVINKNGRPVEKIIRHGTDLPSIPEQQNEILLMECVLTISMGRDLDDALGEIAYIHMERKNMSLISFPFGDYTVLVTSNKFIGPISLARKIIARISKFRRARSSSLSPHEGMQTVPEEPNLQII